MALSRPTPGGPTRGRPTPDRPRLLVLRALGLGDLLTGVPALRALRQAYPDHELVLAAPRVLEPLAELAGAADRVLDATGLSPVPWDGEAPDLAVNLHGRGPQSHGLLAALRPRRLVAFGCPDASHEGPAWRAEEHEVRRWCRLLEESLHLSADPRDLGLPVPQTPAAVPGAVVVHPGAAYPARRWPPQRFAAVARWAVLAGHDVVVTGGPDEVGLAEEVRRRADLPRRAVLAGRTDLTQLAAQIASARLLVSGDTGVAHLASAFSTPSVLLFGPTAPSRWGPPEDGPHAVIWHGDGAGDPWSAEVDPALLRVEVDEVLAGAEQVLGLRQPAAPVRRTTPGSA
jgi:ADP-heptose:LPS heptosyltransferase